MWHSIGRGDPGSRKFVLSGASVSAPAVAVAVEGPPSSHRRMVGFLEEGGSFYIEQDCAVHIRNPFGSGAEARVDVRWVTPDGTVLLAEDVSLVDGDTTVIETPIVLADDERIDVVLRTNSDPNARINVFANWADFPAGTIGHKRTLVGQSAPVSTEQYKTVLPPPPAGRVHMPIGMGPIAFSNWGWVTQPVGGSTHFVFRVSDDDGELELDAYTNLSTSIVRPLDTQLGYKVREGEEIQAALNAASDGGMALFHTAYLIAPEP